MCGVVQHLSLTPNTRKELEQEGCEERQGRQISKLDREQMAATCEGVSGSPSISVLS